MGHDTQEVGLVNTVKGLCCICEEEEAWEVMVVAVMLKVLHVATVREARLTFLTRNLEVTHYQGKGNLQRIRYTACKDLVEDRADRDGSIVR